MNGPFVTGFYIPGGYWRELRTCRARTGYRQERGESINGHASAFVQRSPRAITMTPAQLLLAPALLVVLNLVTWASYRWDKRQAGRTGARRILYGFRSS